ncbi:MULTISPECIES: hypothetical protein [unclassified Paenibacillus]|uniref:hypothetical protein n=1 Tax=unclassified Paenibacillus TaxID=185978 RepID=UPI00089A41C4|nr:MULTISPECIES: hypothetical protein [unclassified Paenibacillus]OMC68598.1 hypothetical protein BK126_12280 [Paenibacillus sp. FSL H7-0326]SDW57631.1 hypothetical protein SAMN05518848_102240 [Paenibacillus sp. PDC88]
MISAVAIGFSLESLSTYTDIAWAHHDPSTAIGMSNREYMLMVERAVVQSDVVVFDATNENLSVDEVVIIHTAYTNRTPIIAVGLRSLSPLLEEMVSQRLPGLDFVVDHLMANYRLSK